MIDAAILAKLVMGNLTCWTFTIFDKSHKELFRVIPNVFGKERMASPDNTITTGHVNSAYTGFLEWFDDACQACMKKICGDTTLGGLIGDLLDVSSGKVSN
jgi:hypothetical protein